MTISLILLFLLWLPTRGKVKSTPSPKRRRRSSCRIEQAMERGLTSLPVSNLTPEEVSVLRGRRIRGKRIYVSCPLDADTGRSYGFVSWT